MALQSKLNYVDEYITWFRRKGWRSLARGLFIIMGVQAMMILSARGQAPGLSSLLIHLFHNLFYYLSLLCFELSNCTRKHIKEVMGPHQEGLFTNPFRDARVVKSFDEAHPRSLAMLVYRLNFVAVASFALAGGMIVFSKH